MPRGRRGERGTLYELPLLVLLVFVSAAVGFGHRSWAAGLTVLFGVPAALFCFFWAVAAAGRFYLRRRLQDLAGVLAGGSPEQRLNALAGLVEMGAEAASAAPAARPLLGDAD
ncbi:MAG: hypothetical protein KGL53_09155, partial [Elusimicrobia bacterium]|nr:hypothetical protein [Elusimicrobiota bacterium]